MHFQRTDSLATQASLLELLKDLNDQDSWQNFYTVYWKLIFSFAIKHGLTGVEAEEVVQETFITVARSLPEFRYDPERCSFKTWLLNVTLWRIQDQLRKRHPEDISMHCEPGDTERANTVECILGPESERLAGLWEEEWKKYVFERALARVKTRVKEKQLQIFDLYALEGWPARKVARSLGVSLPRVYVAKHRLCRLLSKEIQRLQELAP
jgi:RNA polymerase sigma factor (sigma-70 family)